MRPSYRHFRTLRRNIYLCFSVHEYVTRLTYRIHQVIVAATGCSQSQSLTVAATIAPCMYTLH